MSCCALATRRRAATTAEAIPTAMARMPADEARPRQRKSWPRGWLPSKVNDGRGGSGRDLGKRQGRGRNGGQRLGPCGGRASSMLSHGLRRRRSTVPAPHTNCCHVGCGDVLPASGVLLRRARHCPWNVGRAGCSADSSPTKASSLARGGDALASRANRLDQACRGERHSRWSRTMTPVPRQRGAVACLPLAAAPLLPPRPF